MLTSSIRPSSFHRCRPCLRREGHTSLFVKGGQNFAPNVERQVSLNDVVSHEPRSTENASMPLRKDGFAVYDQVAAWELSRSGHGTCMRQAYKRTKSSVSFSGSSGELSVQSKTRSKIRKRQTAELSSSKSSTKSNKNGTNEAVTHTEVRNALQQLIQQQSSKSQLSCGSQHSRKVLKSKKSSVTEATTDEKVLPSRVTGKKKEQSGSLTKHSNHSHVSTKKSKKETQQKQKARTLKKDVVACQDQVLQFWVDAGLASS